MREGNMDYLQQTYNEQRAEALWIIERERLALMPIGAGYWLAQAPYDFENDRERPKFMAKTIVQAVADCYADLVRVEV